MAEFALCRTSISRSINETHLITGFMRAVILKRLGWSAFLAVVVISSADAQSRRRGSSTPANNPPEQEQQQQNAPVTNPATGNPVQVPAPPPTDPSGVAPSLRQDGVGTTVDTPRKSLRIDGVSERSPNRERVPITYDHIREDDKF